MYKIYWKLTIRTPEWRQWHEIHSWKNPYFPLGFNAGPTQVAKIDLAVDGCSDFTHFSRVSTVDFEQVNTDSSATIVKALLIHRQFIRKVPKFTVSTDIWFRDIRDFL